MATMASAGVLGMAAVRCTVGRGEDVVVLRSRQRTQQGPCRWRGVTEGGDAREGVARPCRSNSSEPYRCTVREREEGEGTNMRLTMWRCSLA